MKKPLALLAFTLFSAACGNAVAQSSPTGIAPPSALPEAEHHRLAFVQAACGGCHAVEAGDVSPNPSSPPFADIANREGLTRASLVTWLTDAHNYPEDMDFDLDPPQVEQIADHILTLRKEAYRPVPE
ncbi:MAG: c-type cytochrome [Erythrobacter sp.]